MNAKSSPAVLVLACVLLAAFFMPWLQMWGVGISGYELGKLGSYGNYAWIIPVLAVATVVWSFTASNLAIGAVTGVVPILAIIYGVLRLTGGAGAEAVSEILRVAPEVLSIGAYLTIASSVGLLVSVYIQVSQATTPVEAVERS